MAQDNIKPFEFSETSVNELKKKYSIEMKDADDNPIKVCMGLIFEAATQRDPTKRNEVSLKLSQFLIKPDGLVNLFLALIDFDTSSQRVTTHNQRFLAVANIITCLPKLSIPYHEYCDNISKQLKPLLIHPIGQYSSLASIIIKALIESPHTLRHIPEQIHDRTIADVVLSHTLNPLTSRDKQQNDLSVTDALIAIHNLTQNRLPVKLLIHVFPNLFYCLVTLYETSSHLKAYLKHILIEVLNGLKPGPACCLLEQTILHDTDKCNIYKLKANDDEISIEVSGSNEFDSNTLDELVINLLDESNNDLLTMEFFFHFQAGVWSSTDADTCRRCAALIEPLLTRTMEDKQEDKPDDKPDLFTTMAMNSQRSLRLTTRMLSNYLDFLQQDDKCDESRNIAHASIVSCINILEVLCSTSRLEDSDIIHNMAVPVIQEIRFCLSQRQNDKNRKLLQSIDGFLQRFKKTSDSSSSNQDDEIDSAKREHDNIMKDLNDKLVPVRVHALIRLKQLLLANDRITLMKIPQLYPLVESTLADQESYVFLSSINLLAEMSMRRTDDILPKLIELYSRRDLSTQQRINVGEVLARLTRRLNATAPHYASQIMNALLESTADPDELIRMSSLTNIGFISANLGDSLGKYILDIILCVERILSVDTIQVKCAAIDLFRTTLMGLDKMKVESIQREMKSIYKTLKQLKSTTIDENLCLQIALALDEIDRLAKEMLGVTYESDSGHALVKNIRVLSLLK